ncbi:MAG: MBL fold metallo-hydrolase [Treponema sp.]|jgi:glyoxylase-like metal-dependent hydrolase (beta-lactamase superfamily II)|nr:MBL fold metallo-hydrolase [Treponema sp.]
MNKMIIAGLVFGAMTSVGCNTSKQADTAPKGNSSASGSSSAAERDVVYPHKLGQFEVFMMVESQRDGNADILVGADETILNRYIPAGGFKHTANAFLVKLPGQNILIDTGTGSGGIIIDRLKKLGVTNDKVDAVLITHLHGDHFGGLQKDGEALYPNARVYVPEKDYKYFIKTNVNQGAVAALAPYDNLLRLTLFEPGVLGSNLTELMPGITPIANYGHTPGHTVFLLENSGSKLIIGGDFLHISLVQFPNPDISASYDMDKQAAAASRKQILDYAAANRIPIGGMHVVYPGMGTVEKDGNGYKFTPAQ